MGEAKSFRIDDLQREASQDHLWLLRGPAIESYAHVEMALCLLFAKMGEIHHEVASLIFFKINARARSAILDKLIKRRCPEHSEFWNSFDRFVEKIDATRNSLVHWHSAILTGDKGFEEVRLIPPGFWPGANDDRFINKADISDFIAKCDFAARLCGFFSMFLTKEIVARWDSAMQQTWHDIFRQPVTYPIPDTHPLFPKPGVP